MAAGLGSFGLGAVAAAALSAAAVTAVSAADAQGPQSFAFASGYGGPSKRVTPKRPERTRATAVETCLAAAADRYGAAVVLAEVNRAWRGTQGWIVDLSLDVARDGKAPRRRDVACRQSEHGLQVARY